MTNPFKPTAGATPPLLVGRDRVIEEFLESLDDGPGAPGLLELITGARGVGKTVMLTALAMWHVSAAGWSLMRPHARGSWIASPPNSLASYRNSPARSAHG